MLILSIGVLAILALTSYLFAGRKSLHPAVVFCSVWAANLFIIWLAGDTFYRLSAQSLILFVSGAFAFTIGTFVPEQLFAGSSPQPYESAPWLYRLFIVTLALSPVYFFWLYNTASAYSPNIIIGAKMAMTAGEDRHGLGLLVSNFAPLSSIVALLCFFEYKGHKLRAAVSFLIALCASVTSGSRSGLTFLILGMMAVSWFRERKLNAKVMLSGAVFIAICFAVIAVVLGKGANSENSIADNLAPIAESIAVYTCGGTIAFDQAIQHPANVIHNQKFYQQFIPLLNVFGADIPPLIPNIDTNFTAIGPNALVTNVYTAFFFYSDYGWPEIVTMLFIAGLAAGLCFNMALRGSLAAVLLYGFVFSAIVLSIFSEYLFVSASFAARIFIITWLTCETPRWLSRLNVHVSTLVAKTLDSKNRA